MWFNPFLDQRLAEERVKDRQREAEQVRLIRVAKGPKKAREGERGSMEGWGGY